MTSEQELNLVLEMFLKSNLEPCCFGWYSNNTFNINMQEDPLELPPNTLFKEPLSSFMQELIGLFVLKVFLPMKRDKEDLSVFENKDYLKTKMLESYFDNDNSYKVILQHPTYFTY